MDLTKIKKIFIVLLVLTISLTLSACFDNGIDSGIEDASLSGRLVVKNDEKIENEAGLIVLEKDSKEVARKYNDYEEEIFQFKNLNTKEEYTLNIYKLGSEKYTKSIVLNKGQNDLGNIQLELEKVKKDEKDGVFIFEINTEYSPMQKENVRKALAYSINKKEISDIAENFLDNPEENRRYITEKANRITPQGLIVNDGSNNMNLEQNISKADSLLEQNYTIKINHVGGEFYELIVNSIKKDIDNIDKLNVNFNIEKFNSEEYQKAPVSLKVWSSEYKSPLLSYEEFVDLDKEDKSLLNKIKMNLDSQSKALEYLDEFESKLIEEGKVIPVYHRASYEE